MRAAIFSILTDYTESGGMMASRGPFLEHFHQYFFPESKAATRWIYPPGYAWIFRPLAGFEFPAAARIWLVINTMITLGIFLLLADSRQKSQPDHSLKYLRLAWYFFLIVTFQPMLDNAWHGQVTGLIFLFFCLGYWLLRREYYFLAGIAWGLMIPMKNLPGPDSFLFRLEEGMAGCFRGDRRRNRHSSHQSHDGGSAGQLGIYSVSAQ